MAPLRTTTLKNPQSENKIPKKSETTSKESQKTSEKILNYMFHMLLAKGKRENIEVAKIANLLLPMRQDKTSKIIYRICKQIELILPIS